MPIRHIKIDSIFLLSRAALNAYRNFGLGRGYRLGGSPLSSLRGSLGSSFRGRFGSSLRSRLGSRLRSRFGGRLRSGLGGKLGSSLRGSPLSRLGSCLGGWFL